MNERWHRATNIILFFLVTWISINIQTVLWGSFLGSYTAPLLWLLTPTYFALRRPMLENIIGIYLATWLVASHSLANWGALCLTSLAVYGSLNLIRNRVYMESTTYFSAMGLLSVLLFQFYNFLFSRMNDLNPISHPEILRWLVQSATTAGLAPLFFAIFEWIDEITKRSTITETADSDNI